MEHVGAGRLENWLVSGSSKSKLLLQPANFVFKIRSWMSQFRISTHAQQPREPHNPRRDIHESSLTHDLWPQRFKLSHTWLHHDGDAIKVNLSYRLHTPVSSFGLSNLHVFYHESENILNNLTNTKHSTKRNSADLIFKLSSQFFALAAFRVD